MLLLKYRNENNYIIIYYGKYCNYVTTKSSIQGRFHQLQRSGHVAKNGIRLARPALDTKADSNETDWQCNIPVGVQIKILYNPVRAIRDKFSIVGASLSVEESTAPVDYNARLAWSVLFREVRPKSKTSRWWEEMTSRDGSSYSIFWIFAGIIPEGSPPGPYVFSLGSVALSCFIILRPYY
ncbi:uncharacterized protein [Halyomorpha halys]|uniref:uncharacterized protein isoform X2 n=1 Tax=Halyomorpha halys TaxID=286706 RepID=UPI0034D31606